MNLSRRAFAQLLGAGAAAAALPFPLRGEVTTAAPKRGPVRLSANENPFGPSSKALEAMRDAVAESCRYPDEAADALMQDVARLHNVSPGEVILGDGSSEILKLAAEAFTSPSRKLVLADPTFEAIAHYADATKAEIVKVPLDASYAHDVDKMAGVSGTGIIYVCNPNNPTATITPKTAVRKLLDSVSPSTIVFVDEAYHHYADSADYESVMPLVRTRPNLVVARTFSKIYGMAGLRCGYAVGQHETIAKMQEQQAWDSMNVMALAAARASFADSGHVAEGRKRNAETREVVTSTLARLGYKVLPSQANFIMIDVKTNVRPIITKMREHEVHVGRLFPAMPSHLRVTIGRPEEMTRFLAAFQTVMA
jgi:histidinol-phosphate aminotransferase